MPRLKTCLVDGCNPKETRLFRVPRNEALRETWKIHLKPYASILEDITPGNFRCLYVCESHFEKGATNIKSWKYKRCPTLFTDKEISTGIPSRSLTQSKQCEGDLLLPDHNYAYPNSEDHNYSRKLRKWPWCDIIPSKNSLDETESLLPSNENSRDSLNSCNSTEPLNTNNSPEEKTKTVCIPQQHDSNRRLRRRNCNTTRHPHSLHIKSCPKQIHSINCTECLNTIDILGTDDINESYDSADYAYSADYPMPAFTLDLAQYLRTVDNVDPLDLCQSLNTVNAPPVPIYTLDLNQYLNSLDNINSSSPASVVQFLKPHNNHESINASKIPKPLNTVDNISIANSMKTSMSGKGKVRVKNSCPNCNRYKQIITRERRRNEALMNRLKQAEKQLSLFGIALSGNDVET